MMRYMARHGEKAYQSVVSSGQHNHPKGLFYGGREPTWSNLTLRAVLREHARRCARLGWIDFHTGLGPSGLGERIFACRDDAVSPNENAVWLPARQAYSHSASVGRRYTRPARRSSGSADNRLQNSTASSQLTLSTGWLGPPWFSEVNDDGLTPMTFSYCS